MLISGLYEEGIVDPIKRQMDQKRIGDWVIQAARCEMRGLQKLPFQSPSAGKSTIIMNNY